MKFAGRVSSVYVIDFWQVIETVVEEIFLCSCVWIKFPGGRLYLFLVISISFMIVYHLLSVGILPSGPHISGQ